MDWSPQGLLATGCGDNAIRVFSEEPGSLRDLMASEAPAAGEGPAFQLAACRRGAHPEDVNCVRWHPTDGTLLASAGDDCTIKLWRYQPAA